MSKPDKGQWWADTRGDVAFREVADAAREHAAQASRLTDEEQAAWGDV